MAVVVVALAGVLYLQWSDWPPGPVVVEPGEETDVAPPVRTTDAFDPLAELDSPREREDFDEVVDRTLFRPDRRPKKEEKEPDAPPVVQETTELDGFDLTAVLITAGKKRAWLKNPGGRKASEVREGDDVSGWTVSKIEEDSIILERQGQPHTIDLLDFSKPAAVPAPTRRGRAASRTPPARPTPPAANNRTTPESRNPRTNRNVRTPPNRPSGRKGREPPPRD